MRESLSQRVSRRLADMAAARRGFKKALAERLNFGPSWVSPYVQGDRAVTLDILEAMSELSGVPVAELVAPPDTVYQLDADEARLVRALRRWPKSVQHALGAFVGFFADESASETQTRNLHEYWRRMPARDREWFYGIAVLLREGTLSPDVRAGLARRLEAETSGKPAHGRRRDESQ